VVGARTVRAVRSPRQILEESVTIAVVGASRHEDKAAYAVPLQLKRHGWRVIPVNPFAQEIWGERCYAKLTDIPEAVDLVNVFRPSAQAAAVVADAVTIGAKAVWLQQGIISVEAREIATTAGLDYVEDACTAVIRAIEQLSRRP
jgi:predicted CoA-binding protein